MFSTGDPFSAPELADALARIEREGQVYLIAMSDAQFFAPQGAAWSPALHVRHLRKSVAPLAAALRIPRLMLRLRFGRPRAPSRSFAGVREAYRGMLAAGGTAGRFTPSAEPMPQDAGDRRAEITAAWSVANAAVVNAMGRWSDAALDGTCLPHPLMGLLTIREMLAFTVYHTAHHLSRIAERAGGAADR